eukprot:6326497-Amphidinium_carterae.1
MPAHNVLKRERKPARTSVCDSLSSCETSFGERAAKTFPCGRVVVDQEVDNGGGLAWDAMISE